MQRIQFDYSCLAWLIRFFRTVLTLVWPGSFHPAGVLQCIMILLLLVVITLMMQKFNQPFKGTTTRARLNKLFLENCLTWRTVSPSSRSSSVDWRLLGESRQRPSESQLPAKRSGQRWSLKHQPCRLCVDGERASPSGPCVIKECPSDQISFFMHSGAANVVPGKICVHNTM